MPPPKEASIFQQSWPTRGELYEAMDEGQFGQYWYGAGAPRLGAPPRFNILDDIGTANALAVKAREPQSRGYGCVVVPVGRDSI